MGGPKPRPADDEGAPRPIDDEGLPRPPPVHGKRPCGLLKALERGESITFMAIAVGLLVIALVMFAEGTHRTRGGPAGRAVRGSNYPGRE